MFKRHILHMTQYALTHQPLSSYQLQGALSHHAMIFQSARVEREFSTRKKQLLTLYRDLRSRVDLYADLIDCVYAGPDTDGRDGFSVWSCDTYRHADSRHLVG